MIIDRRKLNHLPGSPGVYVFKDREGEILYIGKAKSVRTRVRSYFGSDRGRGIRVRELARLTTNVDTILVGSEAEALLLEANLIKEHQPRFNIPTQGRQAISLRQGDGPGGFPQSVRHPTAP